MCLEWFSLFLVYDQPSPLVSESSLTGNDSELSDRNGGQKSCVSHLHISRHKYADWLILVCHSNHSDMLIMPVWAWSLLLLQAQRIHEVTIPSFTAGHVFAFLSRCTVRIIHTSDYIHGFQSSSPLSIHRPHILASLQFHSSPGSLTLSLSVSKALPFFS